MLSCIFLPRNMSETCLDIGARPPLPSLLSYGVSEALSLIYIFPHENVG